MKKATPYLLLMPALTFTLFVLIYPLCQNLINSFRDITMMRGAGKWIGLHNYGQVLQDPLFWLSFKNSLSFSFMGTLLSMLLGLASAVLLNERIGKINDVFKFLYILPWVVSPVVGGFAWKWLFNDHFGIINHMLISAGIIKHGITWLGSADTALLSVIVARVWQFFPFAMVMFLAALQTIPQEQYEAAAVDGAKARDKFLYITLPHLQSVTAVLLLLGLIWSFNDFNMVYIMTKGGPINASMVLPVLVRQYSFVMYDFGKGSALSMMIFMVLVSLSFLYLKTLSKRENA